MDTCPRLKCRGNHVESAVCVPVSVLGRTVGVIHTTTPRAPPIPNAGAGPLDQNQTVDAADPRQPARAAPRHDPRDVGDEPGRVDRQPHRLGQPAPARDVVQRAARDGTPVSLVLADVDDFKELNDRHGHEAGDRPCRAFAAALHAEVRPDDVVCRYGGEEFVVVLPRCSAEDAQRVFQRVQKRVGMIGDDGRLPRFTASYGVTDSDGDDRSRRLDLRSRRRALRGQGRRQEPPRHPRVAAGRRRHRPRRRRRRSPRPSALTRESCSTARSLRGRVRT